MAAEKPGEGERCEECHGSGNVWTAMSGFNPSGRKRCDSCGGSGVRRQPAAKAVENGERVWASLPSKDELRDWRSLRSLAAPGPDTLKTVYRVAFPVLLDAFATLESSLAAANARIAELEKSLLTQRRAFEAEIAAVTRDANAADDALEIQTDRWDTALRAAEQLWDALSSYRDLFEVEHEQCHQELADTEAEYQTATAERDAAVAENERLKERLRNIGKPIEEDPEDDGGPEPIL